MKAALANYAGFHNLWQNPSRLRPINDLDELYAEYDVAPAKNSFTNILAIGKTHAGFV